MMKMKRKFSVFQSHERSNYGNISRMMFALLFLLDIISNKFCQIGFVSCFQIPVVTLNNVLYKRCQQVNRFYSNDYNLQKIQKSILYHQQYRKVSQIKNNASSRRKMINSNDDYDNDDYDDDDVSNHKIKKILYQSDPNTNSIMSAKDISEQMRDIYLMDYDWKQSNSTSKMNDVIPTQTMYSSLCIVPPDDAWDIIQKARHLARDHSLYR